MITEPVEDSVELQKTTRAHQILVADQKSVFSRAVDGFVTVLDKTDSYLSEEAWNSRSSWTKNEWEAMETWGWFRHFCRNVSTVRNREIDPFTNCGPTVRTAPESLQGEFKHRLLVSCTSGATVRSSHARGMGHNRRARFLIPFVINLRNTS
jgi:MIF4G like